MEHFCLVDPVARFSRTGHHKDMAGMLRILFCYFFLALINNIGHDINYLAISGVLSVGLCPMRVRLEDILTASNRT